MIPVVDETQRRDIESMAELLLSEVNVKDLKFVNNEDGVLVKKVKPDFKKLGPKFGKQMKAVAQLVANMSQKDILRLELDGSITLQLDGQDVTIDGADVEIISEDIPGWLVANEGNVTIALDITVTDELRQEGIARDLVNRIQNIRKSRNYDITDRITVAIAPSELIAQTLDKFKEYIMRQVLATDIQVKQIENIAEDELLDIDGVEIKINVALSK
jgi:isoleucyl-tRNA synthetase